MMNSPDAAVIAIPLAVGAYSEYSKEKEIKRGEALQSVLDYAIVAKHVCGEATLESIITEDAMKQGEIDFPYSFDKDNDTLETLLQKAQEKWDKGHSNKLKSLFYDGPNPKIYEGMIKAIADPLFKLYVDYLTCMNGAPLGVRSDSKIWYANAATKTHEEVERIFIDEIKKLKIHPNKVTKHPEVGDKAFFWYQKKYLHYFSYWHSKLKRTYLALMKKAQEETDAE